MESNNFPPFRLSRPSNQYSRELIYFQSRGCYYYLALFNTLALVNADTAALCQPLDTMRCVQLIRDS